MSLYGHTHINIESLKHWANSLSVDHLTQVDIGGKVLKLTEDTREMLRLQTQIFKYQVDNLKQEDDWRTCLCNVSPMFYNAFLRIDNSSIRIADFYECLITPSNMKTYKKIIKGFDYVDVGEIVIQDATGKSIASLGKKSDLIWSTFYEYFINENDDGSIDHTHSCHEQYLSVQLFDIEGKSSNELLKIANEILIRVSIEYDMDFKVYELDSNFKQSGDCSTYHMQFTPMGFELVPMLYFTCAINSNDERLSYLSYYQVIEYFFVRCQNYYFLEKLAEIDIKHINHNRLGKILSKYKYASNERSTLNLVFSRAIEIRKFKKWISLNPQYQDIYCNHGKASIDISSSDSKIIEQLTNRVYSYRCSIAHAKGDVDEFVAIPSLSKEKIANELPLLKYLALEVIQHCSEPEQN